MNASKYAFTTLLLIGAVAMSGDIALAQSVSGRATGGRAVQVCLCGLAQSGGDDGCFVDSLCADVDDCGPGDTCPSGFFCLADSNCCATPKCVEVCGDGDCTVEPGAGICENYDACNAGLGSCPFNTPSRALGMKTSLIRSFAGCPSSTFPIPNSQTGTGVPTCAPPYAHSSYQFAAKSGCTLQTRANLEAPCTGNVIGQCMNLDIAAKCSGVLDPDDITPTSTPGWHLVAIVRATIDDRDNGPMTVINFPISIAFGEASGGRFAVQTDTNTILEGLGLDALPACTSIEIVSLSIQDPTNNPFAKLGAGTRPKGS